MSTPFVLIECGDPDLPNPVVTKDEGVTTVQLNWAEDMQPDIVLEVRRVLEPLRGEHPRFGVVLDRLKEVYG